MGSERVQTTQKENREIANAERSITQAVTLARPAASSLPQGLSTSRGASSDDIPLTRDNLLFLKRTVGNRAVVQLLQRKGKLSQPGDAYEREADGVADQVLRMPEPSFSQSGRITVRS